MVKKPGLIIKPVEFEEVNPHGKPVQRIVKHKLKKTKGNDSLAVKKTKFKGKRSAGQ
jgi:U3 small nucleolar RNA-associated protein 14